jgi:hypothetical protein
MFNNYVCPHANIYPAGDSSNNLINSLKKNGIANAPDTKFIKHFQMPHGAVNITTKFSDDFKIINQQIKSENLSPEQQEQFKKISHQVQEGLKQMKSFISSNNAANFPSSLRKRKREYSNSLSEEDEEDYGENSKFSKKNKNSNFLNNINNNGFTMPDFINEFSKPIGYMMLATRKESIAYALGMFSINKKSMVLFICNRLKNKNNSYNFICFLLFYSKVKFPLNLLLHCQRIYQFTTPDAGLCYMKSHGKVYLTAPPYDSLDEISLSGYFSAKHKKIKCPDFLPGLHCVIDLKKHKIDGYDSEYSDFLSSDRNSNNQNINEEDSLDNSIIAGEEKNKNKLKYKQIEEKPAENEDNKNNNKNEEKENDDEEEQEEEESESENEDERQDGKRKQNNNSQNGKRKNNFSRIRKDGNGDAQEEKNSCYELYNKYEYLKQNIFKRNDELMQDIKNTFNSIKENKKYKKYIDDIPGGFGNDDQISAETEENYYNYDENQASINKNLEISTNNNKNFNIIKKYGSQDRLASSPAKLTTRSTESAKITQLNLYNATGATRKRKNTDKKNKNEKNSAFLDESYSIEIQSKNNNNINNNNNKSSSYTIFRNC